jgi:hypothetical protein
LLSNTHFYNSSIRKTLEIFGVLFSNIIIRRYDNSNVLTQELKLPLVYSARDRLIARVQQIPDLNEDTVVGFTYPAAAFELTDIRYDTSRKLNNATKIKNCSGDGTKSMFAPVPYILTVELNIIATNTTDMLQVIEQIIPYFTPTLQVSANLSDFTGTVAPVNIPITLDSIDFIDNYADNYQDDSRTITYTLRFSVSTYIYGQVTDNSGQIIKEVHVSLPGTSYFNDVNINNQVNNGDWS